MPLLAKAGEGKDFELTPSGNHHAVCVFVEDIGTHEGSYQGVPNTRHQIVICWELSEKMKIGENAGKPFMVSKFYTLSLDEKANLRKDLDSWRGVAFTEDDLKKGFDVERVKGANCLLNIIHEKKPDGNIRAKISSISPILPGMQKIAPINKEPPKWIAKKRSESIESRDAGEPVYNEASAPADDSIPF
jgi:hypothetical protein